MRILVTNDDGVHSRGLKALAEALEPLGEVWVVAPATEQSATSHSISLHRPLRMSRISERVHAVDGTPSDAVYLGMNHVLREARPELVASGINHGANLADDITYSGTVAAAIEATMLGVPAVAFSLAQRGGEFEFGAAARFARSLVSTMQTKRLPRGVLLNVNVPPQSDGATYRVTRQGRRSYGAEVLVKQDPRGRPYFWIGGDELAHEDVPGSDANAVYDEKIISVTPLHLDSTHDPTRHDLLSWELPGSRRRGDDT
jgi:5'-nucleotidase